MQQLFSYRKLLHRTQKFSIFAYCSAQSRSTILFIIAQPSAFKDGFSAKHQKLSKVDKLGISMKKHSFRRKGGVKRTS